MIVYVVYEDQDNSCSDPDCCGGPCPSPSVKVFSSKEAAKTAGYKLDDLTLIRVDSNEFEYVDC